jgi:hypothetical protein
MINSNFKKLLNRYQSINFDISYNKNKWQIVVKYKYTTDEDNSNINEDPDEIYSILLDLIEGNLLYNYHNEKIGSDDSECYSFVKEKNKIKLYSAELFHEFIQISEDEFNNELDFYIKVFSKFKTIELSHKILKENELMTPLDLFITNIKEKGFLLKGFKIDGMDNDGYMNYLMIIEDSDGKIIELQYPQKDGLFGVYDNDAVSKYEDVSVISYHSSFNSLLIAIRDNTIEKYFDTH